MNHDHDTAAMNGPDDFGPPVDLKDSVQLHLLTELALLDSKDYRILPQETVDHLKKECTSLPQRIEKTRFDLIDQGRILMKAKHDAPGSPEARDAEERYNELAENLRSNERDLPNHQKALLQHTAAVLQHAHNNKSKKTGSGSKGAMVNGVPPSPESMHTTTRNSIDPDEFFIFDQGSLYQSFDQLEEFANGLGKTPIEIPQKSPNRTQSRVISDESDKLRLENSQLRAELEDLRNRNMPSDHSQLVADTEDKLARFNGQLRELIVRANPANFNYHDPPTGHTGSGETIDSHLNYLADGLYAIEESPPAGAATPVVGSGESEFTLRSLWDDMQSGYANLRQAKLERRKARQEKGLEIDEADMSDGEFDTEEQYSLPAFSSKMQWLYKRATSLQEQKGVLQRQIKQQRELNSRSDSEKDQLIEDKVEELEDTKRKLATAEYETSSVRAELSQAMEDLEHLQKAREEETAAIDQAHVALKERNARIAALESGSKENGPRVAAAEASVQQMTAQLQEATEAREAAEKSLSTKEAALAEKEKEVEAKETELSEMTGMVAEFKMEATLVKAELDAAYGSRKERAAEAAAMHDSSEMARVKIRAETLEKELKSTAKELQEVIKQSLGSEKKIAALEGQLDGAAGDTSRAREEAEEAFRLAEQRLDAEVARLQKDKEALENELDTERLKSGGTGGTLTPLSPGGSKTSFLTESYRKGLRAERKKCEELLKNELVLRRKLEDELRAMKRAQGPGKSPLSPRPA